MDLGEVLKRTWDITWRYKGLWVLGILASCGRGNGGGGGGGGSGGNFSNGVPRGPGGSGMSGIESFFAGIEQFFNNLDETILIVAVIAIVLFFLVLALVFFLIGILGQAGLIAGFDRADEGESVTLVSAIQSGMTYFLRLLGLQLMIAILVFILAMMFAVFALAFGLATLGIGLLCLIPLICVLIPLMIAFGLYIQLSQVAIVVESVDIIEGLRRGWAVIRQQPGQVILMALVLFLGGGVLSFMLALPLIALVVPVIGGLAFATEASVGIGLGLAAIGFLVYLPILIVLSGILQTYIQGAWTITYRRLTGRGGAELGSAA